MKFLICGIGSIGQRHYRNLKSLGHDLALFRAGGGANASFIDKFFSEQQINENQHCIYRDFNKAIKEFKPDAVFITNPNSKHIETALRAARLGQNLFIEKPLTNNMDGVDELKSLAKEKNLKIMIGYNLRWHPLLKKMKTIIANGDIGRPISAHIEMGENIEDWHPWEDYRDSYAAYKEGGGGAVLCFSHDIDYLYWFFGKPEIVYSIGGKITPLSGDAEDMVKSILEYKNKLIVSLHLDYWQRPPRRSFEVIGTKGRITWDYYTKDLILSPRDKNVAPIMHTLSETFDRNDMFIDEIKDYISALKNEKEISISLDEGIDVLDMSLKIKESIGF